MTTRNFRITAQVEATTFLALLVGAVLPFGGYVVDRWLARRPLGATG